MESVWNGERLEHFFGGQNGGWGDGEVCGEREDFFGEERRGEERREGEKERELLGDNGHESSRRMIIGAMGEGEVQRRFVLFLELDESAVGDFL